MDVADFTGGLTGPADMATGDTGGSDHACCQDDRNV